MYGRIVIPTDGSRFAENAAETGFDLAESLGADVFIVCVVDTGPLGAVRLPGDTASAEESLTKEAHEYVARLAERAEDRGIPATTEIREGTPVQELLEYTEEIDAELVVMGSRGRGGVNRMLLGSVTDGVTRFGDIDVLVVESDADAA